VAVTVFTVLLGGKAGDSAGSVGLLFAAVFTGQLSIGWSNDRLDARRDERVARTDKPVARGDVSIRQVDAAIAVALAATVASSLALGWRAGGLHLGAVAFGWLYNLGLKSTWISWLPYAVAFGSLPAIATLARPDHAAPASWAIVAAALLGVAGHLTNTLPDLVSDRRTGVLGFPHRIGARPTVLLAAAALLAGSVVLVVAPAGSPSWIRWLGLGVAGACTAGGSALAWRRPDGRWTFAGTIALVAVDLLLLLLGPSIVG
jgi:4-hydroxybenzoate polyprenyltransferase